jgi:hypothetical protein
MERREWLKLVALTALSPKVNVFQAAAACHMDAAPAKPHLAQYKLQFFSEDESRLLDRLMEMIIPADSHSPGAHACQNQPGRRPHGRRPVMIPSRSNGKTRSG